MNRFGFFDPFLSNTGGGGTPGSKIISIKKTGEQGDKDEYTVTYEDGTTLTFYVDNCNEVEVTTNGVQPTDERVELWVDLNSTTTIRIPEINDLVINQNDTWSSEKIDNELDTKMPIDTNYAADINMNLDSSNFVLSVQLKDQNGNNIGHLRTVNLPMDSMVVEGSYDNTTKNITLTLNNGNTVVFPIGDLINGLQTEITENNPLDVDLIDGLYNYSKIIVKNGNSTTEVKPITNSDTLTLEAGNNIIITASDGNAGLDKVQIYTTAEVNQNAFSTVNANGTNITADLKTDTLKITPGDNIQIAANADDNSLTITAKDTTYDVATNSSDGLMSKEDKDKLNNIESNAEVNQNAFSTVKANGIDLVADTKTDTLTMKSGTNIQITGCSNDDSLTISTSAEPNQNAFTTVDINGTTVNANAKTDTLKLVQGSNVTISGCDTTNTVTITAKDTTYDVATNSSDGLMSKEDKDKLDGIEAKAQVNQNAFTTVKANGTDLVADSSTDALTINSSGNITITGCANNDTLTISTSAEPNQNAFTTVKANQTDLVADSETDTLTIKPGTNIQITGNATEDSLTITTTAEINQNAFSTVNANGTNIVADSKTDTLNLIQGSNVTISGCNTTGNITISAKDTTYDVATNTSNGLMSKEDKDKLNNIEPNAQVNQNAFSTVNANGTNLVADSKTDTLNLASGNNISITGCANNDTLTISTAAEVNQNAFSTVSANGASIAADSKTDTLTITPGNNVQITGCGTTSNVVISTNAEVNQNAFSNVTITNNGTNTTLTADSKSDYLYIRSGDNIQITACSNDDSLVINTNAEVNQNAFSTIGIRVGSSTTSLTADSKTDSLTIVQGNNVSLSSDSSTDTFTINSTDQKVQQDILAKPTSALEQHPLILSKQILSSTGTVTEEAYRKNTLYYDNALNSLTILNALNSVNANQAGVLTLVDSNGVSSTIRPANSADGKTGTYYLPTFPADSSVNAHSGILALQNDITDQLIGAGIEIDFANKTYKKLGRTDYDNLACFGNRKLCSVDRSMDGTNVEIIKDFSTVPGKKNIMVQQPKVYYKVVPITTRTLSNGTIVVDKCQYWVSDKPTGGMQIHPAFTRGNIERNFIYHGAYPINYAFPGPDIDPKNSVQDTTGSGRAIYTSSALASVYGYQPRAYQTRDWYRKGAVGQDTYYNQNMSIETIYSASLEQLLMLIEYGPNFQTNFAAGWTNLTDNSSYNCSPLSGACFTNGNKSMARGNNSLIQGTDVLVHGTRNASGTYSYSYRGVENFFGGLWEWIDGINLKGTGSGEKVYIISPDSLNYADDTTTNYLDTGIILPNTNDWIKSFAYSPNYDWILMPGEVGGSGDSSLPIGDYFYQTPNLDSNSWRCALLGGVWIVGLSAGLFCWDVGGGSGHWDRGIGARLMMLGDNENS